MKFLFGILIVAAIAVMPTVAKADINNLDIGGSIEAWGIYQSGAFQLDDTGLGAIIKDHESYYRSRIRLWFSADLCDNVMAYVSVESDRGWSSFDVNNKVGIYQADVFDSKEIFLEEGYIKIAQLYDSGLTLKIGRQYISVGKEFIVGDANPFIPAFDTPTTFLGIPIPGIGTWKKDPFDAIVATYDWDCLVGEFIYASNAQTYRLDDDFDTYMLNFTYTGIEGHTIEAYISDVNGEINLAGLAPKIDVNLWTAGARAEGNLLCDSTLKYMAELAFQFGKIDNSISVDFRGIGGYAGINWSPDYELKPELEFIYTYLSGDDLNDSKVHTFLMPTNNWVYGEIANNIVRYSGFGAHSFNVDGSLKFCDDKVKTSLKYWYLLFQDRPSGIDRELGQEVDGYVDYYFNEYLSAQLSGGVFFPGDGVKDTFGDLADSNAYFVRGGVAVKF